MILSDVISEHPGIIPRPASPDPATPKRGSIVLEHVKRVFPGQLAAVDGVDLAIEAGEFFTLLGPSGCGKTTLLRMIAGFETPDAGRILISGRPMEGIPPHRRPGNMVFQSYVLFPHLTEAAEFPAGTSPCTVQGILRNLDRASGALTPRYAPAGMTHRRAAAFLRIV